MDYATLIKHHRYTPGEYWLKVSIEQQRISLFRVDQCEQNWPVSTAAKGIGQSNGSFQTPSGMHRVAEKIGDNCKPGTLFIGRKNTAEIADIISQPVSSGKDQITSRILWLSGQEPGLNQGGNVDTYKRYIYIHGTPEEGLIGQPVSHGCIRMKNRDIIQLFELIEPETLVYIAESD